MNTPKTDAREKEFFIGLETDADLQIADLREAFDHARQLEAQVQELREALSTLHKDVEYIIEDGTLPITAIGHASMVKAREVLERTK